MEILTRKLLGLPAWAWLGLAAAGAAAYLLYRRHEQSSQAAATAAESTANADTGSGTLPEYVPIDIPVSGGGPDGSSSGGGTDGSSDTSGSGGGSNQSPSQSMTPVSAGTGNTTTAARSGVWRITQAWHGANTVAAHLSEIARENGMTLAQLYARNPQLRGASTLSVGEAVRV